VANTSSLRSTRSPYSVPPHVWTATALGQAATVAALAPREAMLAHQHLSTARDNFMLEGGLHALFLITPLHNGISVNWETYQAVSGTVKRCSTSLP